MCLLTLPFTPVLYYGTEIGMSQNQSKEAAGFGGDHEVRHDMPWDETQWDHDLLAFTKATIELRRDLPVLRRGQWHPLFTDSERQLYGYKVVSESDEVHIYFNLSDTSHKIGLNPSQPQQIILSTDPKNMNPTEGGQPVIHLEGLSGVVLVSA